MTLCLVGSGVMGPSGAHISQHTLGPKRLVLLHGSKYAKELKLKANWAFRTDWNELQRRNCFSLS